MFVFVNENVLFIHEAGAGALLRTPPIPTVPIESESEIVRNSRWPCVTMVS